MRGLLLFGIGRLAVLMVLGIVVVNATPSFAAPEVWLVSSLTRVRPDDAPGAVNSLHLYAAKGEYESLQIVVHGPAGGLSNVNIIASDLLGPNTARITSSNITLYREHYVYISKAVRGGQNRSEGPGWYPDGLIPFVDPDTGQDLVGAQLDAVPFDLAASKNQPIWVDIFVPRGATAGEYHGVFTITSDQGEATAEVTLTVWDFQLPLAPSLKSCFGISPDYRLKGEELLRNRIMPRHAELGDQRYFIDHYGLSTTNVGFWSGAALDNCAMTPTPSVAEFRAAAATQETGLQLYDYSADEIDGCTSLYITLKQWARNMHQAGINQLVTMTPTPELYDDGSGTGRSAVDIWVLLPKMHDAAKARVTYVQQKGDQVWSYNCLIQDDYSPKWQIDFSPLNFRLQPGFINQSLGLTGLLYWKADLWTADPWNDVGGYSASYPGEGMLIYPGQQVGLAGVAPSMRLKWLRDGVEDYEYIELLKARGAGEWALEVARTIGPDWTGWARSPEAVEDTRRQLGEAFGRGFVDVTPDNWAYDAIEAALASGIVAGYPDGTYRPTWQVTRGQMAVFIARSIVTPTGEQGMTAYTPPTVPTYWDVPVTYWSYKHVEYLTEQAVVSGYPDDAYRPANWVTRDQMAVYIARAIADPRGEQGLATYSPPLTPTFGDVPTDQWAYRYIEYLAQAGIVQGYTDGFYLPEVKVTRAQMAVYIARAFGLI